MHARACVSEYDSRRRRKLLGGGDGEGCRWVGVRLIEAYQKMLPPVDESNSHNVAALGE